MKEVTTALNMRSSDKKAVLDGTSERELMLRAAKGIANAVFPYVLGKNTAIVTGEGNNGGDGYALAEILMDLGVQSTVISILKPKSQTAAYYENRCVGRGVTIKEAEGFSDFSEFNVIVDCIFGTGFRGKPEGLFLDAIEKINGSRAFVISVDINSGLNGETGLAEAAVKSSLTLSIGTLKVGNVINQAKDFSADTVNIDIGIPLIEKPYYLTESGDFKGIFAERKEFSHKGTYKRAGIFGGCINYLGAVKLAASATAALVSGAGLSKLIIPKSLCPYVLPLIKECTLCPYPDNNEGYFTYSSEEIDAAINGLEVLALGMGMGRNESNSLIIERILKVFCGTVILDADGLYCLKGREDALLNTGAKVIITPHAAEFSRLTDLSVGEIIEKPVETAKAYAKKYRITVLLKGTATVITDGDDVLLVNEGSVGMAKGGSGDVLSGIIAGISAFSKEKPLINAACGAFLAGRAGSLAAKSKNVFSTLPGDTVEHIFEAVNEIISS